MKKANNNQWEEMFDKIAGYALSDDALRGAIEKLKDSDKVNAILIDNYILQFIKLAVSDEGTAQTPEIVAIRSVLEVLDNRSKPLESESNNLLEVDFTNGKYMN
ncbi:hypothetical protein [uncultured Clostridium sp.]|uniref:hypothetical protein n=1 Tax=uncultured Clostridium sp. TaxID=59620 RepID=UPI0025CFDA65|nr:hypothetical protein [uncultured Clostridium sp.]